MCGQVDFSGANLRGGQQIFVQAKHIGHNGIAAVGETPAVPATHPVKATLCMNYQAMIVMDSSGVTLLE